MTQSPSLPFHGSYWVISGKLLAGPYPGALQNDECERRLSALVACGIRRVINLMEPDEVNHQGIPFVPYLEALSAFARQIGAQIECSRYPIKDGSIPDHITMKKILDEIDASLQSSQPVYVHCWGGKGRTGTVVGCYLIRHAIVSNEGALEHITWLRRNIQPYQASPETPEQNNFVCSWKTGE